VLNFKRQEIWSNGFTLIELVIGIGLTGLLISLSFSVFNFTSRMSKEVSIEDDFLLQGRFAVEYIRDEVSKAIKIVSMEDYKPDIFPYTDTLPFFIIQENKEGTGYKHVFYRLSGSYIYRTVITSAEYCPQKSVSYGGDNFVLNNVIDIKDTYYDKDNELLCLVIKTKNKSNGKEYCFMETLYLRDDINLRGSN
jgi:type II secretory pathway pseudopilin PulG